MKGVFVVLLLVCLLLPSLAIMKVNKHSTRQKLRLVMKKKISVKSKLPASGEQCTFHLHQGVCKARADCADAATQHRRPGLCDGAGIQCCFDVPQPTNANPWCDKGGQPGECKAQSACVADASSGPVHWSGGACRGNTNFCCLHGDGPNGDDATLAVNAPKPAATDINFFNDASGTRVNLIETGSAFQTSILGDPGDTCRNDASCTDCHCKAQSQIIQNNLILIDVAPFSLTTLKPFGELLQQTLEEVKTARPELFWGLKTAGSSCCRPVKIRGTVRTGSLSNHAWGSAVDVYFGAAIDAQGDDQTQAGLLAIAKFLNDKKIFWGAGFPVEDSMHFEPSKQLMIEWVCAGKIAGVTSVPGQPHACDAISAPAAAADAPAAEHAENDAAAAAPPAQDGTTPPDAATTTPPDATAAADASPDGGGAAAAAPDAVAEADEASFPSCDEYLASLDQSSELAEAGAIPAEGEGGTATV